MRIFIAGANFFNYSESLKMAFEKLGNEVKLLRIIDDTNKSFLGKTYITFVNFYHETLMRDYQLYTATKRVARRENDRILKEVKIFKPDLFISFAGYCIQEDTLRQIICPKVIWVYDSVKRVLPVLKVLHMYDIRFFFEKTDIDWLNDGIKRNFFLPLCADENDYYPIADKKNKDAIDISFVGALSRKRIKALKKIHEEFPDVIFKVYGKYLKKYQILKKWQYENSWEKNVFMNKGITPEEVNELYARSKICLNLLHQQSKYGINIRFYEILAAKCFQLVEWNEFVDAEWGEDVVSFKSEKEMIDKIRYYLVHEKEREQMAERGYLRTINHDLFLHRSIEMIDILKKAGYVHSEK